MRSVVFTTVVRHGNREVHEFLEKTLETTDSKTLRNDILKGLTCTKDRWRLNKYLANEFENNADMLNIIATGTNPNGNYVIWKYIKNNWDTLYQNNQEPNLVILIQEVVKEFNTEEQYEDFYAFITSKKSALNEKSVKLLLRSSHIVIKSNIKWITRVKENFVNWVNKTNDFREVSAKSDESYRLPKNIKPYLYELTIKPYIGTNETYGDKAFTFEGQMKMHLTCIEPTNQIVFHAYELNILENSLAVLDSNGQQISLRGKAEYELKRNFMTLTLDQTCKQNSNYTLGIKYTGLISEELDGFYRSSYTDANGSTTYIGTTHFQPGEARRVFPCFDEPAFKTQLDFIMIRHKNFSSSYFNSPLVSSSEHEPYWFADKFERTVSMSTYLVGFVVSSFEVIETFSPKYNIKIEVAARPEAIASGQADYALNETALIIDYFADYFNVMYPMEKSSMLRIFIYSNFFPVFYN